MRLSEVIITLLAMAGVPLLALYLYELIYNYIEENDEVPLDEEEKGAD